MKCFVSHRPPSREGRSVGREKKMNPRGDLGASEGRAAKYESFLRSHFVRNSFKGWFIL